LSFLLLLTQANGQSKVLYHQFEETASSFKIIKWNISSDSLPYSYVQETTDKQGRVIELRFYKNKSTEFVTLCYLFPWTKFEYPNDTTIIEYSLGGKGEKEDGLECSMPYRTVYHLSLDKRTIERTEQEIYVDTAFWMKEGWTVDSLKKAIDENKGENKTCPVIGGFENSFAKLNGIYPTSKDFKINDYYFSDIEKIEIEKAIRRK
jgi:hypothetical protein